METLASHTEARTLPVLSASSQGHRELKPEEVSSFLTLTQHRGVTDEEIELIEMRYRQALALMSLENLFADGQLNCM